MYYASSVQTGSPIARPPAKYLTTPPVIVSPAPDIISTAPSSALSTSLVASRTVAVSPLVSPRLPVTVAPDETVDKARDKYLQGFQQRQVKHKPSLFLAPFKKRQDKGKKKDNLAARAVSSESQYISNDTTVDVTLCDFQPEKDKKEKRSFSGSLKNKLKRVFRRTSNNSTTLPVQQIDASRDYYGGHSGRLDPPSRLQHRPDIPSPDHATLQRVKSRTPSLEGGRPALVRPTSRGSLRSIRSNRSLHSEAEASLPATSRVTSWGSSSAGGTLTQREMKRLTVIHEAKDSISSEVDHMFAPKSPKRKPPPIPGFAAFREPMEMDSLVEDVSAPVDPKRVFSALMKEISTSKPGDTHASPSARTPDRDSDVFVSSATKDLHHMSHKELHSNANKDFRDSIGSDQLSVSRRRPDSVAAESVKSMCRPIKATIRAVAPSEKPTSPGPDRTTSVRGTVRIPRPNTAASSTSTNSDIQEGDHEGTINFRMNTRRYALH
ncbi:hypothetical protein BDV95DRAFT_580585, partial [Massariosphaeria phaeospora]